MTLITKEIETDNEIEYKILRIYLDEKWSASDFFNLFESLSILNNIFIEIETIDLTGYRINKNIFNDGISDNYINLNGEIYKKLNFADVSENLNIVSNRDLFNMNLHKPVILPNNDLTVKEIKYASPGWCDLVGLGKIAEQIFELIKFYLPNKNQRIQNELAELDLLEKRLELLNRFDLEKKDKLRFIDLKNSSVRNLKQLEALEKIKKIELKGYN